ncbi:MAG: SBBP repeat-containing protein [Ilumatobacteraceae bacterium]
MSRMVEEVLGSINGFVSGLQLGDLTWQQDQAITEIVDTERGSLANPFGVAVDGAGNAYGKHDLNNVFRVMTGEITEIIDISGDGAGMLTYPSAVTVDGVGNVYVTGSTSNNVFRVSAAGVITEIIDFLGDGAGNRLVGWGGGGFGGERVRDRPSSDNVFRVSPGV